MLPDTQISMIAIKEGVPPKVLKAMCQTESGPKMNKKNRYEPGHYAMISKKLGYLSEFWFDDWKTQKGKQASEVEMKGRASSWGVGHVMGWRYRIMGFTGEFKDLNDNDELAMTYAARALKEELKRVPTFKKRDATAKQFDDYSCALALYNTGDGTPWPVAHIRTYKGFLAASTLA